MKGLGVTMFGAMDLLRVAPPFTTLLDHGLDYAGLFPPAALPLDQVIRNYAEYRIGPDRGALGRLLVPAGRLAEFAAAVPATGVDPAGWRLAATLGADLASDSRLVAEANDRLAPAGAAVDAVEAKVGDPEAVALLARSVEPSVIWYGEIGLASPYDRVLDAIAAHGGFAKIRMGGTTADLFPDPDAVLAWLLAVVARGLPFKATAGLHHPLRGVYPLTYLADSPSTVMYGFLNLVVATMLAQQGAPALDIREALLESDGRRLRSNGQSLEWRHYRLTDLERCRAGFHGFGSCAFREPIDELGTTLIS